MLLSQLQAGTIIGINETVANVTLRCPYIYLGLDESEKARFLRVYLLDPKYINRLGDSTYISVYEDADTWCNDPSVVNGFMSRFDAETKAAMSETEISFAKFANGERVIQTINRKAFLPSFSEMGGDTLDEGQSYLDILKAYKNTELAPAARIAYTEVPIIGNVPTSAIYGLRSASSVSSFKAVSASGEFCTGITTNQFYIRPMISFDPSTEITDDDTGILSLLWSAPVIPHLDPAPNGYASDGNSKWIHNENIVAAGVITRTFLTENKFTDKNIEVNIATPAGASAVTGGELTAGNGVTSLASNGLSNGSSIDTTKKVALSENDAANYYEVESSGAGNVSRGVVSSQVTAAGFFDADLTPVAKIGSDSQLSNTATKKYYIKQSTLSTNSITPLTSQQTVTIGDGYYHENRTVTIDAMNLATFSNEETSGVNYNDISSTAPVLNSGGYLFVNAGYSDNVKISLAQLVPNASDISGHSEYILYGHTAYDDDGALVTGSIPTYDHTFTVT